jgi:signal transduction histidine kinase
MNLGSGKGSLSVVPVRQTRWIAATVALWLLLLMALVAWWSTLVMRQARRIAELEALVGQNSGDVERTRLMLAGESAFFVLLLLSLSLALAWLYWRENSRARSMQAFFAAVTHELRTPLTSIRLQAEAIAEGGHESGQSADLARRLLEDSHRLESQIDKTLELARIEGGGPLAEQAIPLRGWLDHCVADCAQAHGDRLDALVHVEPSLPPIMGDAAAVQMILRNLIENSVRHSGMNPVSVRLTAREREGAVVLEYHDAGRGLSGDPRRYGALFGRGSGSNGSGVGLYLVRALMRRMGGRVDLIAAPGEGFRAELLFRVAREA